MREVTAISAEELDEEEVDEQAGEVPDVTGASAAEDETAEADASDPAGEGAANESAV
ncbi:MAG: hypothetical protein ABSA40_09270 [Candidatus Dormibacteria bacterium]|jgi:hypothetical protein